MERRPLKSRGSAVMQKLATTLARAGLTPNQISILSVVFSIFAFFSFFLTHSYPGYTPGLLFSGAVFIQLRLLCNLMDGMVAVEHKKKTPTGDLFNDVPDRFSDVFIIMGFSTVAPYSELNLHLGYAAALLAVLTAYIRVLGGAVQLKQEFLGPMAKPHRMAVVTFAALLQIVFFYVRPELDFVFAVLVILVVGSAHTCVRRLTRIAKKLNEREASS